MTLLYTSPRFLDHDTGRHPERAERLLHVTRQLERTGLAERCQQAEWQPISEERLLRVHEAEYLTKIDRLAASGGGRIEADTVVSSASGEVARLAAGAVCDAVERVVAGEDSTALCLVRPPGHHALPSAAMGFCLLSNIALAARTATQELQLDRVLIVDWDVHHGNGTQAVFWQDEQVGFFSIHRWPFYPGTGSADETGAAAGLGSTLNLPVEMGTVRSEYLKTFQSHLEEFADRMRPQLVLVSAGFDSHREDPIGSLGLETEDFRVLTQIVQAVASTHADGRVVCVLEGGYNPSRLAGCVQTHLETLLGE